MKKGIWNIILFENFYRYSHGCNVIHTCTQNDWLTKGSNVLDEGIVIAFPGANFICADPHALQSVRSSPREWGGEINHPFILGVLLESPFSFLIEGGLKIGRASCR